MQAATYTSIGCIAIEGLWRGYIFNTTHPYQDINITSFSPTIYFIISYILCMMTIFLDIKRFLKQYPYLRTLVSYIHGLDGISVLFLGYSLHMKSAVLYFIAMLMITKFFLIHLLARMVTGEVSHSNYDIAFQTTKSYIHHTGSFLFLPHEPYTIISTSLWRFISMTGHAVVAYKGTLSHNMFEICIWASSYARNVAMLIIIILCYVSPVIRRGFGVSAVGHVAYLISRIGPVFRLGSIYVPEGNEKEKWQSISDQARLYHVLMWKYPMLSLELMLMMSLVMIMFYLRVSTAVHMQEGGSFM